MSHTTDFYKTILDNLYDGVYLTDCERKITYWNKGAERITGYSAADVVDTHCWDDILTHVNNEGTNLCREECPLAATIRDGQTREAEVFLHHRKGHRVPVLVRTAPIHNEQGKIIGAVEIFNDNTSKVADLQKIEELQQMVFIDPLTGLANRRYIELNLQSRFEEMFRYGWNFGILMMDLDHFKGINDRHGHDIGDKALQMVARTLLNSSRNFDIIGRWGGEEFIAIITNLRKDSLSPIAERYRQLVEQSHLIIEQETISLTISIGAALATSDDSVGSLLKRADELLYRSKSSGRNRITSDPG